MWLVSYLENLSKKTSFNLTCVGRNIKKKPYRNSRIKYFKWDFETFKKRFSGLPINIVELSRLTKNKKEVIEKINGGFADICLYLGRSPCPHSAALFLSN